MQSGPSPQIDVAFVLAPWTPSDKRIARLINFVDQGPDGTGGFGLVLRPNFFARRRWGRATLFHWRPQQGRRGPGEYAWG